VGKRVRSADRKEKKKALDLRPAEKGKGGKSRLDRFFNHGRAVGVQGCRKKPESPMREGPREEKHSGGCGDNK